MVTKERAHAAVYAAAPLDDKARLLIFLDSITDQELAQWSIKDGYDDKVIYDYIALKAPGALLGLVHHAQGLARRLR